MFPPVAKEFFEWREAGSELEPDLAAAIAAALVHESQHAADGGHAGSGNGHARQTPGRAFDRARALRGAR